MESERNMIKVQRRVLLLISTVLLLALTSVFTTDNCTASSVTIYVDDSNTDGPWNGTQDYPYRSIQDGINAASSGDTIYVLSGTYNENIEINENIALQGQDRATTVINGEADNKHTVKIYGSISSHLNAVSISGFTIRNDVGANNRWAGLYVEYVEDGSITDCIIRNSYTGIMVKEFNHGIISRNTIKDNDEVSLYVMNSDNNEVTDNIIQDNSPDKVKKGAHIYSSNGNEFRDNTITDCSLYGIEVTFSSNNRIYHNHFTGNTQNARDIGSNEWDNGYSSGGNYWGDYNDYDTDEDGIGDSPYNISGGGNKDEYPLGYFLEPEPNGGNQQPTAYQPTIYPNPATSDNSVSFSGSGSDSDGYIAGYNWRSSIDGQLSTYSEFSTSSLSVGTHTIYFKVQDNEGTWSSEQTASLTINPADGGDPTDPTGDQEPTAFIDSITPNPAEYMMMVSFCGHGTDEDGYITEWKWTSSIDGVIGNEETLNTSDLSLGTHTIYFQVQDNASEWSKQVTESLIISLDPLNQPPIANAGGPYSGNINDAIIFDGSASYDEDGEIIEYLWDFGDGTNGFGESITHTYISHGNYTITLTVTDDDEDNSTDTTIATVVQSSGQNSGNTGAAGFELELSIPLIIIIEAAFVVVGISMFLFWIKRK